MITINDKGIILKTSPFGESHLLVQCFLKENGVISGLARVPKKYNPEIMVGNIAEASWKARLIEQLGYYSFAIISNTAAFTLLDRFKTSLANSAIAMLHSILNEREIERKIFELAESLLTELSSDKEDICLIKSYIDLEIELLNRAGFGLDLKQCVVSKSRKNLAYISPKSGCAVSKEVGLKYHDKLITLPAYMAGVSTLDSISEALQCLKVVEFFMEKNVFSSHKKGIPRARASLIQGLSSYSL